MDRARLDSWCEKGILGLILGILVFAPLATGAVRPLEWLIIQGMMVVLIGLWMARFWLRPGWRVLWPPVCWTVLGFLLYAIARYLQADIEYIARQELLRVIVYGFLFFIVLDTLYRQESTQAIVFVLVSTGMVISFYAIYQYLTASSAVWHFARPAEYTGRGSGTYICPNHLAGYLEMVIPLALAFVLTGRLKPVPKIYLAYAALAMLAGLAVTMSRGGWIAGALSIVLFFLLAMKFTGRRLPALLALGVILGLGVIFALKTKDVTQRVDRMLNVPDARLQIWKPAWKMWQDHFWTGVGPGHFDYRFREYRPDDIQMRPLRTHNDYLNTLVDWGVIGGALVFGSLLLLALGIYLSWKFVHRVNDISTKPSNRSSFLLGASVGLFALLIHSFLDFNMQIPANAMVAITLMALLTSQIRFATERFWFNPGVPGRLAASAIALGGMVFLSSQTARGVFEYRALEAVALTKDAGDDRGKARLAALKMAHEAEPMNPETVYELGEAYRLRSWEGRPGYQELALDAMKWFQLATELNPYDGYSFMRYGMCLHWLGRSAEAAPFFEKARALDPRGYYMASHQGWHFFQLADYAEAKRWFELATQLSSWRLDHRAPDPIATSYLRIVDRKLAERVPAVPVQAP